MLPIKLLRNKPIEIRIKASGGKIELESDFIGPKGVKLKTRTHFSSDMGQQLKPEWDIKKPNLKDFENFEISREQIYKTYFHGPSFQVLEGICKISPEKVLAVYKKPSELLWKKSVKLLAHPMLIEAAFQACGYRDMHIAKRMTLPDKIGEITAADSENIPEKLFVLSVFKETKGNKTVYDSYVFDKKGKLYIRLKDYYMIGQ